MKKIFLVFIFGLFLFSCLDIFQIVHASSYTDIDVTSAYNMITNGSYPDLIILDVRNENYSKGYIHGSIWIPYWEFEKRLDELVSYKNQEVLVYSHCGCEGGFSERAADVLTAYNFTKVYNMYGGILAWQSAGYPFWTAGESYNFPIDTNSTIIDFIYDPTIKQINLTIDGPTGTTGTTNITISKDVLKEISVFLDNNPYPFTVVEDKTHNLLYLQYTHNEHEMIVNISEKKYSEKFPFTIVGIGVSAIALIAIFYVKLANKPFNQKMY